MNDSGETDYDSVVYHCIQSVDFETISGAIFIIIFIFSIIGNVLLGCVLFNENLKNVTNLFVMNLACSDLVFTITLPFWGVYQLHHWIFGEFACKFMTAAYIIGMYSSVILLTAMTVDRFITVVLQWPRNPVKRQRCAIASCAASWVISTAASVSDAMKVKVETQWNNLSLCEDFSPDSHVDLGYYLQASLLFFLPFIIIVFSYSAILKIVLTASNRKKHRTVVLVLSIVTAFFLCWGPFNVLLFISSLYKPLGCYANERLYIAYSVCRILAFSHCCMNPLLYMIPQKLHRHILGILCCENPTKKNKDEGIRQSTILQNAAFIAQNSAVVLELPSVDEE